MTGQWILMIFVVIIGKAIGQCTFPSPFASSTWHDSTRGTLVFTNSTVTGWTITLGTAVKTTLSVWQCVNNSDPSKLVIKASQSFTVSGKVFYVYACLKVTEVTAGVSYTYVQLFRQEANAGQHRLKFSDKNTLSSSADICDDTLTIPTLDFHVLVKSGSEAAAAIKVPDSFLFSADFSYIADDGTVSCNDTSDAFDMCANTSALAITKSISCTHTIAYSAGGALYCVAKVSMTSYDCAVFYNRDASITGATKRFTCICSDGDVASVAPSNCTINQSPTGFPTAADMVTAIGYKLDFKTVNTSCATSISSTTASTTSTASSSNAGAIAGGVIAAVVVASVIVLAVIVWKCGKCGAVSTFMTKVTTAAMRKCPCCSNKVEEGRSEKVMQNGHGPKAESATVNEVTRPPLHKERSTMSAITRSSTLDRQGTVASIGGIDLKSDRSEKSVTQIKVKPTGADDSKEPRLQLFGKDLSFLICCPAKEAAEAEQLPTESAPTETSAADKGGKKSGKKKAKGGKGKGKEGQEKSSETQTGKGDEAAKGELKQSPRATSTPKPNGKTSNGVIAINGGAAAMLKPEAEQLPTESSQTEITAADKGGKKRGKKEAKGGKGKGKEGQEKLSETQNGKGDETANGELKQSPRATSTPKPNSKSSNGVLAINGGAAAMLKPEAKANEWRFLACCFGNRSPEPPAEEPKEPETAKKAPKGEKVGKGAQKGGKKGGKKRKKGGKGKKEEHLVVEDVDEQDLAINRAKTMPEKTREKTTISLTDTGKIKVDVYIPDDKTNLQLKDTVTVMNGKVDGKKLPKSKTTLGVVTPPSEKPGSAGEKTKKKGDKKKPAKGGKGGKASKKKKK